MGNDEQMFLPIALNIAGKRIVIIGGGRVGLHKATILSRYTSDAIVVSPAFRQGFELLPFSLVTKEYDPDDLNGAFIVYICTENTQLNARIKKDAEDRGILASVCDNPALCDFISPAIHSYDGICIAVTSNGRDVKRSIRIRDRIRNLANIDKNLMK